jgi:hypothetical protein
VPAVCYSTVKSRLARLTRLDECGAPAFGPRASLPTEGFIKVENKWDIEDGEEFYVTNAWGEPCLNERDKPRIKGGDVTIDFCGVDPDSHDIVSGARVIAAEAGDTFAALGASIGFGISTDTIGGDFALELWTKIGGSSCTGGAQVWLYSLYPWLSGGRPGDQTLERGNTTFQQSARAQGASAAWANGPYEAGLKPVLAGEVHVQYLTLVQPPAGVCGALPLAS